MRPIAKEQSPVQRPLNYVLGTAAHIRLLRILAVEVVGPISPPDAAERTGLTEAGARRALNRLAKTGFVRKVGGGRSRQYGLREGDPLVTQLILLFREEERRFDELISAIRSCFGGFRAVQQAWAENLPNEPGQPLVVGFLAGSAAVVAVKEEVQRRLLEVEREFDVMVEVRGFSRADAPSISDRWAVQLVGVFSGRAGPRGGKPPTHQELEGRARGLSRAIAELLGKNPSLIRRALRHLERILAEDQGSAAHDLEEWRGILSNLSPERVREFIVSDTPRAERLRQSSPFFAVLTPEERDRVLDSLGADQ
jgi:DNA-binding Lrp family transcriptional regulator